MQFLLISYQYFVFTERKHYVLSNVWISGTNIKLFFIHRLKLDTLIIEVTLEGLQNKRHCVVKTQL